MAFKCDKVDGWAVRFFPHFRFSRIAAQEEEFFYPIDVETGLLLHRAAAADTGANSTHDRGTAIFHWSPNDVEWEGDLAVPNPGIGDARFAGRPDPAGDFGDWFLNFGGWCEATTRLTGQNVYTWDLFKSGVYDQLGLPNSQEPTDVDNCEDTADLATPQQFQPDATGLHTYVEALEVGELLESMAPEQDLNNFPAELDGFKAGAQTLKDQAGSLKLDQLQALTYYLFYPGSVHSDPESQSHRVREGDWEGITLFSDDLDKGFQFASYSQGYQDNVYPFPLSACRAREDMIMRNNDHPVVFVAWGSHANYFTDRQSAVQTEEADINWMQVLGLALGGLAVVLVFGAVASLATPAGPVLAPVLLALALLVYIASLVILAMDVFFSEHPEDRAAFDRSPRDEAHQGNGAVAGEGAVGTPGNPPPAVPGITPFIRHVVNAEGCAAPDWWKFSGRWGVCVVKREVMLTGGDRWANGVNRRTAEGYTLAHANLEAFFDHRSSIVDCETRASYTYEFESAECQ